MLLPLFIGLAVHAKFRSLPAWLGSSMGFVANVSGVVVSVLIVVFSLQSVLRLYIAFSGVNLTVKAPTTASAICSKPAPSAIQSCKNSLLDGSHQWSGRAILARRILIAASDRKLMNDQPSSMLSRIVVGVATLVMFGTAIGMFVF